MEITIKNMGPIHTEGTFHSFCNETYDNSIQFNEFVMKKYHYNANSHSNEFVLKSSLQ
jgi:hypothetical protein